MLTITSEDIRAVLRDYGVMPECVSFTELQRYDYDNDPVRVRLIIRAELTNGRSVVIRFKNEEDAPQDIIEAQSRFAALLYRHGIETPKAYTYGGDLAHGYSIGGYDVVVTVEDFADGEIQIVDPKTAEDTGELLAKMHCITEKADAHADSKVLFDPLAENDLFSFEAFTRHKNKLLGIDSGLYHEIVRRHSELAAHIEPFAKAPRFAVQGDISICNLYRTKDGRLGVFDFNRCGDNVLYFDAVMQAIFEARLMDYPTELAGRQEEPILTAFLKGYLKLRPFTEEQKAAFPYLYALTDAFWAGDIIWSDNSLAKAIEANDDAHAHQWMKEICRRESVLRQLP